MSTIAKRIKDTIEKIENLESVRRHYENLEKEEVSMEAELEKLEKQLGKELKDIESLEKLGVKSLFHKVLGDKNKQLEKERQEYLELSLKHTNHIKSLDLIKYELELLADKVNKLDLLTSTLKSLKKDREKEILQTPSPLRNQLIHIISKKESLQKKSAKINEVIKKGEAASLSLQKVIRYFAKAKDWGYWDMAGKGRYRDYQKHNAINYAVGEANRSNLLLNSFSSDLAHIGYRTEKLLLSFQSFTGFLDMLFDNLISDWIMQGKIKNAMASTEAVLDKVHRIINSLKGDIIQTKEEIKSLESQRQLLLETK